MSLFGVFRPRRRRRIPLTSRRDLTTVAPSSTVPVVPPLSAPVGLDQVGKVPVADGMGGANWQDPVVNTTVLAQVASTTSTTISPVGTVSFWMTATPPVGWLPLDGRTFDAAAYPKLAAVLGTNVLPDTRQRFPISLADTGPAATILAKGGSWDHTHTEGTHTHSTPGATVTSGAGAGAEVDKLSLLGILGTKAAGMAHTHSVTIPSGTTGTGSGGTTGSANPPWIALMLIVKSV